MVGFYRFRILLLLPLLEEPWSVVGQMEAAIPLGDNLGQHQDNEVKSIMDALGEWIDGASVNVLEWGPKDGAKTDSATCSGVKNDKDRDPFPKVQKDASGRSKQQDFSLGTLVNMAQSLMSSMSAADAQNDQHQSATSSSQLASIIQKARSLSSGTDVTRTRKEELDLLWQHFHQVYDSIQRSFSHLEDSIEKLNPVAFWYYLEREDERRNPSWKRRRHYYMKGLDMSTVEDLHDALYLSHLSYAHRLEDIEKNLQDFQNNTWELIYCTTEGRPTEPAHFLAIQKESKQEKGSWLPWQSQEPQALEVLLVVRGTKEIGDMLSDGMLEPIDYRGGKAHAGIAKAGLHLADKHRATLDKMLEASQRDTLHLTTLGHSLGAGAAAIVAMEFKEHPQIDATAIGFGCPALVSLSTSEAAKDYITTVVSDSDIVPRMSGAAIANMFLDVASYDWTAKGLEDIQDFLQYVNTSVPFDVPVQKIVQWADKIMDQDDRPFFRKVTTERATPVLFPPGDCIHLFRDGFGYTATYTPCKFFDTVEMSRTLLDDHLIPPGYHRALLSLMRDSLGDFRFDFQHDLIALPV